MFKYPAQIGQRLCRPVLKFHKSKRPSHSTHKKVFANTSIFHKIVSVLRNIIRLYLILTRINVTLVVIMGGNHVATWEGSGSNETRLKLICLLCEQWCTGVREFYHWNIWSEITTF